MKRFWFAAGLLAAMLALSLWNAAYIQKLADSITQQLELSQTMAARGAWEQAARITGQCQQEWEDNHAYLHIVSRHADTDEILLSFRELEQYLNLEEMDQYAAENLSLITRIGLLAEMEQPDWLNVL